MKLVTTIRDLAGKARRGFARLSGRVLSPVFGNVAWSAPPWARWVGAHPKHTGSAVLLLVALTVGGFYGVKWWEARPKPVEVKLAVKNPARTPIENEDEKDRGPRPLIIQFEQSVAPLAMAGKDIASGITITPALEGQWKWNEDKELEFNPKEDWAVGAEYKITLDKSVLTDFVAVLSAAKLRQLRIALRIALAVE